ncbi:chaperone modulator CbpM [Methylocella sp.]|uniref:chaperone modulator CbpM n=1 Tax=Methylocella sp. TaxID=1978226 RepID=UPI00378408C7
MLRARIEREALEVFIAERWLVPRRSGEAEEFSDADVARACLIRELRADMGVNDAGVDVILHLVDQLHGLRRALSGALRRDAPDATP